MSRSFKRLERVLKLEASQGYKNKAVVGGIRQFVTFWVSQAREETVDELDVIFVEQAAEALMGYGRLPGEDKRRAMIDKLLQQLADRQKRAPTRPETGTPGAAQPPPEPAPEPASEPPRQEQRRSRKRALQQPPPGARQERQAKPEARERPAQRSRREPEEAAVAEETPSRRPQRVSRRAALEPDPEGLRQNVTAVKGVGPQMASKLANLGVATVADLLFTFPRRYDDYTVMKPIQRLQPGEQVTVIGTIWQVQSRRGRNNMLTIQAVINDGSGAITAYWYNQRWLMSRLTAGMQIALSGRLNNFSAGRLCMRQSGSRSRKRCSRRARIVPIYPLTQGFGAHKMRSITQWVAEKWARASLTRSRMMICTRQKLLPPDRCAIQVHLPESQEALHQARERLAFDELLLLQLGMQLQRQAWRGQPAQSVATAPPQLAGLRRPSLRLTGAQQRVIDEIAADMGAAVPMAPAVTGRRRLRQNGGRGGGHGPGGGGRGPGSADGADRHPGRAALPGPGGAAGTAGAAGAAADRGNTGRCPPGPSDREIRSGSSNT